MQSIKRGAGREGKARGRFRNIQEGPTAPHADSGKLYIPEKPWLGHSAESNMAQPCSRRSCGWANAPWAMHITAEYAEKELRVCMSVSTSLWNTWFLICKSLTVTFFSLNLSLFGCSKCNLALLWGHCLSMMVVYPSTLLTLLPLEVG